MCDEPYAVTLWTWAHLTLGERIDATYRRLRAIDDAGLAAAAYHEPKLLKGFRDSICSEAGLLPSNEDILESAEGIMEAVRQLDKLEGRT